MLIEFRAFRTNLQRKGAPIEGHAASLRLKPRHASRPKGILPPK